MKVYKELLKTLEKNPRQRRNGDVWQMWAAVNSTQYYVTAYMGKESQKGDMGVTDLGFPSSPVVRSLPARQELQETRVQSLGGEDPLEEGMATHSRIPA